MEKILIVEDDRFFREMYSHLLSGEGYEVHTAASVNDAMALLRESEYHLIISDLVMPGETGIDLLFQVKRLNPDIDVIMVTGNTNVETAIHALKNGARDYLLKPVNPDEFRHTVALCMEQRRLLNENSELKGLVHLFQVGQTIANCLEIERLGTLVVDSFANELGTDRALGIFPDEDGRLSLSELRGLDYEDAELITETLLSRYADSIDTFWLRERVTDLFPSSTDSAGCLSPGIEEILILFVRSKTDLQGIVALFSPEGGSLPAEINQRSLHFLQNQTSLAFENAARFASARNMLYIDELTGLFNYRYLDLALDRELKRAERYGSSVALLFIDLDLFKGVNDTHGHLIGSRVLGEVGALLRKSVRDVDLVIRYGGDEYTIILVETDAESAAHVAERIRVTIESHRYIADEGYDIHLSACIGYACFPEDTKSKLELLEVADKAMYRGKFSGRNRVFRALMEE
ncbi:MAG: diguanylate cyclase [Deltaproteobacteria bacterium]|nr:diguanylate cyclase [Deltaproteobacteria bacterium]TLN03667.1 MAG: diguanylate cyclase [bacterium]